MGDLEPIYSTTRMESVAQFVTAHYPLPLPLDCRMVNRGFNDTYALTATDGTRYMFRLSHHRARGPADVRTETEFITHLARSGVPVASPVPTRDGALFARGRAAEGMREGVLFGALDGRMPELNSAADARANGITLAKMHNAAETFVLTAPLYRLDLDHLLHRPMARIQGSGVVDKPGALAELEGLAARTAASIEAFDDLTWTHCHGDCHGFNARIMTNGEAAFFDFDDGGRGYLGYDLGVFLWAKISFGRKLHTIWDAFIEGYRTIRPIKPDDLEAAHAFVIVRHLWVMGEYGSRVGEWGTEPISWIGREVDFLKGWEVDRLGTRLF
ncbi:phosphotransferase [Bradyrhizobium jicamae]|uniref:phosphotransferase enzyme family protein n=1 Tax=Bradyrhizobium jicamae TaxID=280332 RepID=UPI001BA67947|nr:phosphotransferase [Bradyrhizobium jicamae]MBR0751707.1 phosphotransferase [Bradyrhizobium jicamae]